MKTQMDNRHPDGTVLTTCSQLLSESFVVRWSPENATYGIHMRESDCCINVHPSPNLIGSHTENPVLIPGPSHLSHWTVMNI